MIAAGAMTPAVSAVQAAAGQNVGVAATALLLAAASLYLWGSRTRGLKPTIVVIGASFGGLQAAYDLGNDARVVVLDRQTYFEARHLSLRLTDERSQSACCRVSGTHLN